MYTLIIASVLMLMTNLIYGYTRTGCSLLLAQGNLCHIECNNELDELKWLMEECRNQLFEYVVIVSLDVKNIKEHDYVNITNSGGNIRSLVIRDSDITFVPKEINELTAMKQLEISNNKNIKQINLNAYLDLPFLYKINASHNGIIHLETETSTTTPSKTVIYIDLSHNAIEVIPNNCFVFFWYLEFLDLSHNSINNFDMFTFEGLMRLRTLNLSNNKLIRIGLSLLTLKKLEILSLNNNNLTELRELNFAASKDLRELDISGNSIQNIENHAFDKLSHIEIIDLSHNRINIITSNLFRNNRLLHSLDLSYNNISLIENGSFQNITNLYIDHSFSGTVNKNTFQGVFVKELNLAGSHINTLGDEAFGALNATLLHLNLSYSSLQYISKYAFISLINLITLDLSNNVITDLDFDTSDLKNISILFIRDNKIKKIARNSFVNLTSLTELDLSFNTIAELESGSFKNLKKLKMLILNNNNLDTIEANSFEGLNALQRIELVNSTSRYYGNESFSGMEELKYLNSSYGYLYDLGYNTFMNTGKIEIIDLSFNLLKKFEVNTTNFVNVKEIYLNNNKLNIISNLSFYALDSLLKLDLSNNDIVTVESFAFQYFSKLNYLNLSSSVLKGDFLSPHNKNTFKFENGNTSITMLELPYCEIADINKVFVYNVNNLSKLNLSSNKIQSIDKFSFPNMPSLTSLDLSSNIIQYVHPGSFHGTKMLNALNLQCNSIKTLQFGVLNGLQHLKFLNLSNNHLKSFNPKLLYSTFSISTILLDNNAISNINPFDFIYTNIKTLSVGGNPLSCNILAELKIKKFNILNVTADNIDYYTENVDGISCVNNEEDELYA